MVIEEKNDPKQAGQPQPGAPATSIDNIMSGISNTGTVKMNNHRKKLRQRFDIIKKLGQGTYGKVQLGINKETGQEVAIKTIKKCKIETEADLIRIRREVQIMSSVQHPNIIHIYEVFENREKMVLVMEFAAGGELYDYLSERKVLSEDEARRVFRQVATAVYYCHKHKICHRDLKLENILLDENGNAKIADFGLSNVFDDQRLLATFCGSPLYASPEIVKGTPYQGPEVDCWSLGVLLYTLVYGAMPFDGSNFKRLVKQISGGDYYEPKKPSNASPLIREMLTVCPKRRATVEQICNHWWVNEGYNECCLDLAEELANQTPVRLDVLLSLAPVAVTSDQLVVPNPNEGENKQSVARSMSVGSIRDIADIANTEAERRIIDMVAAGGEAALAPSPTRTLLPSDGQAQQPKRKPETTISTESVVGGAAVGARKRDKPSDQVKNTQSKLSISEVMAVDEEDQEQAEAESEKRIEELSSTTLPEVLTEKEEVETEPHTASRRKSNVDTIIEEVAPTPLQSSATSEPKSAAKKFVKTKTTDLSETTLGTTPQLERKDSVADENVAKATGDRRRSRILEVAEKFQGNAAASDKPKKIVIPGVSVGGHKKEFERKASLTTAPPPTVTPAEKRHIIDSDSLDQDDVITGSRKTSLIAGESDTGKVMSSPEEIATSTARTSSEPKLAQSDSKSSNLSLEEARRSMENSIALLNQAKSETNSDVDQLCAKTENVAVSGDADQNGERQKKLKNAREIIGNAIPRLSGMGVRKPPVPFGVNGRSVSGSVVPSPTAGPGVVRNVCTPPDPRMYERESPLNIYSSKPVPFTATSLAEQNANDEDHPIKISTAEITLKSATLPRRKTDGTSTNASKETPKVAVREHQFQPAVNSGFSSQTGRATSLEPQQHRPKEHYIPIQRPGGGFMNTPASSQRSFGAPLSRQSTAESDTSDTQTSTATIGGQSTASSQPIKKSPREFIIPIAVEGGGFVTPRAGSLEPSDSNHSTNTAFSRLSGRSRKLGSIFNDRDSEDESISSPFHRMHRHTSIGRDSDSEDPTTRFTYRLRSTRPIKKFQATDTNDSASSGEEDDEDGFEILTAENLFSTLLSRVRALTNRLNVKDDPTSNFPSSRFMSNLRQTHSPFWHHDPFTSKQYSYYSESIVTTKRQTRLNSSGAWRHSMTRDLGTDIDSMFSSRTGATLPRGVKSNSLQNYKNASAQSHPNNSTVSSNSNASVPNNADVNHTTNDTLDLADLDLSQLRLTKKDLETLSSLTPSLPKQYQEQLLAQLPPNQARKLSRTLSMQATGNQPHPAYTQREYKRSLSGGSTTPTRDSLVTSPARPEVQEDKDDAAFDTMSPLPFDRNSVLRRSLSRSRDRVNAHRRSTSLIRNDLPNRLSYTGDLRSDSNRYTTPNEYASVLPTSLRSDYYSRLPPSSGTCLPSQLRSPPSEETNDSSLRRRPSQRRISRFLRPDFYDSTSQINTANTDESSVARVRRERERETQSVLREIRERSRSRGRRDTSSYLDSKIPSALSTSSSRHSDNLTTAPTTVCNKEPVRKSSIPNIRLTVDKQNGRIYHARNKSVERCCDIDEPLEGADTNHQRRLSISRNGSNSANEDPNQRKVNEPPLSFSDHVLKELVQRSREKATEAEMIGSNENSSKGSIVIPTKQKEDKKVKSNEKSLEDKELECKLPAEKVNNIDMVTTLTNEIDSVILPLPKATTSKLVRPKSYPNKDEKESKQVTIEQPVVAEKETKAIEPPKEQVSNGNDVTVDVTVRPKSYPNSKLTPPKEIAKTKKKSPVPGSSATNTTRNVITAAVEKFIEKSTERLSPAKTPTNSKVKSDNNDVNATPKTKKKIKVVKKTAKSDQSSPTKEATKKKTEESAKETSPVKESKSPEKKPGRGFLYTIGQKFEKMRESSRSKEKKAVKTPEPSSTAVDKPKEVEVVPQKSVENKEVVESCEMASKPLPEDNTNRKSEIPLKKMDPQPGTKLERKSRIDAMIRNLRERSVPHTYRHATNDSASMLTESGLIKRAVSVENMANGEAQFNKYSVNKVLGLFRRIEREQLQQMQSISNNSPQEIAKPGDIATMERPKSGGFVSKLKKNGRPYYTGAKSDTIVTLTDQLEKQHLAEKVNETLLAQSNAVSTKIPLRKLSTSSKKDVDLCPDCGTDDCKDMVGDNISALTEADIQSHSANLIKSNAMQRPSLTSIPTKNNISERERIRNNRKGLILDLNNGQFELALNLKNLNGNSSNNNLNSNGQYSYTNAPNNGFFNEANNNIAYNYKTSSNVNNNNSNNNNNNNITNNNNVTTNHNHNHNAFNGSNLKNGVVATTPTYDNATNYSSDSRSLRDDCESTSTFLSPTEEPELCFDDWSVCSGSTDDHTQVSPASHSKYPALRTPYHAHHSQYHHTPSSSTSMMAPTEASSTPSNPSDSESVIDRIKRRSFYCRFNEKKPKRTSSIVGPAARDFYRELASKTKSRSSEQNGSVMANNYRGNSKSPTPMNANEVGTTSISDDNDYHPHHHHHHHHHYHYQPQTPNSRSSKNNNESDDDRKNKSTEYLSLRSTLTSPLPAGNNKYYSQSITSPDYRPYSSRSSIYDGLTPSASSSSTASSSPYIYGTYNPKRRVSTSYLSPTIACGSSALGTNDSISGDHLSNSCYATLGRNKPKAYDHRSISMLDSNSVSPSYSFAKRYGAVDHSYPHLRSVGDYRNFNSRSSLRTPPMSRSPTNNV